MYFDPDDMKELKEVLEKRETEAEFIRTAIKNEILKRRLA
jgi:tetrahydromethanopterin S-methyltransferase subunit G